MANCIKNSLKALQLSALSALLLFGAMSFATQTNMSYEEMEIENYQYVLNKAYPNMNIKARSATPEALRHFQILELVLSGETGFNDGELYEISCNAIVCNGGGCGRAVCAH